MSSRMTSGMPACMIDSSVPHGTGMNFAVTRIVPGRWGSSNSSVQRISRYGTSSTYSPPNECDSPLEELRNDKWKHPNIVRSRIEKDIKPHLGKLALDAVEPRHIDAMLRAVVKRGAPAIANDVLRWVRRMVDCAFKRHLLRFNPAAAFDLADAGGKELARERALSGDELVTLFETMRQAEGFSLWNGLTVKLLLLLAAPKGELSAARWDELELEADPPVWHLPGIRTKAGKAKAP